MPNSCSVINCTNRFAKWKNIPFFTLPTEEERRLKWLAFINRKRGTLPKKVFVCGKHFITGKKSNDKNHPDFVPSVPSTTTTKASLTSEQSQPSSSESPSKLLASSPALSRTLRHKRISMARVNNPNPKKYNIKKRKVDDTPVQHQHNDNKQENPDNSAQNEDPTILKEKIKELESIISNQSNELLFSKRKIHMLANANRNLKIRVNKLIKYNNVTNVKLIQARKVLRNHLFINNNDIKKMKFYTGLPSFEVFENIFEFVKKNVDRDETLTKLTLKQEFMVVLMRLRLGLLEEDLAYRFGVAQSTISRILSRWIGVMATRLQFLIQWPERDQLCKTMPACFLDNFEKCVVILDCFEIFIEKPNDLTARAQTYSQYKHHNTVKVLLGITPQGTISFVSEPWGGRTSDVHLTENSGILKNLIPGDVVLADRGFTISDSVGLYCAELKIPDFTKGKKQLQKSALDGTRDLASVRIHVERVIGLLRNKYTLLQKILPIKMLMQKLDGTCTLSEILIVCSALCNLNGPVVPLD